jgi:two-component system chemotaxis sensor kinase CheA
MSEPVKRLMGVLDDSLCALSMLLSNMSGGRPVDKDAVVRMATEIAEASEAAGYPRLADIASGLPAASADPAEFDWAVFRLYETLENLDDVEDQAIANGFRIRASGVLRSWCADRVWQVLSELTAAIEAFDGAGNLDARCKRIAKLLHYISYACRADGLPEATELATALSDLFDRGQYSQDVGPRVIAMARNSIPILRGVLGSIHAGRNPMDSDVESLSRQISALHTASDGAVSPLLIEERLGLPASFHNTLDASGVKKALIALNAKQRFFIVRTDLNSDENLALAFTQWLTGGVATQLGNVTVFVDAGTEFDFLLATQLDEAHLVSDLKKIDPSGVRLRIERALVDSASCDS